MIKKVFSNYCKVYYKLSLDKWIGRFSKFPKVLFYHGVENEIIDTKIQCVQIKFDLFEKQMQYLQKNRYDVISLAEFNKRFDNRSFNGNEIVLTFDDGYKNNKNVVFPYLQNIGFPFSVFVSTKHIDKNLRFPPYIIRSLLKHSELKELDLPTLKAKLSINSLERKKNVESDLIKFIKSEPLVKVNSLIKELMENHSYEFIKDVDKKYISEEPMNWNDVKYLSNNGVEIGSHCHDHIVLHKNQSEEEIFRQLKTSKDKIENYLGSCDYLAYPNGRKQDVSGSSRELSKELNYTLAFSTWMKSVNYQCNKAFIPRYIAPPDYSEFIYILNNNLFGLLN